MIPSRATADKLTELLRGPRGLARAGETPVRAPLPVAVLCGAQIDTAPRPHYSGTVQYLPDLSGPDSVPGATDGVVLADLNGAALEVGRYYAAVPSGHLNGTPLYWTGAAEAGGGGGSLTNDQVPLTSDVNLNGSSGAYVTILNVTLPSTGVYLISGRVSVGIQATLTGTSEAWIRARVKSSGTGGEVDGSACVPACLIVSGQFIVGTAGISFIYDTADYGNGLTLTLEARRCEGGTVSWTSSFAHLSNGAGGGTYGGTHLGYVKIG